MNLKQTGLAFVACLTTSTALAGGLPSKLPAHEWAQATKLAKQACGKVPAKEKGKQFKHCPNPRPLKTRAGKKLIGLSNRNDPAASFFAGFLSSGNPSREHTFFQRFNQSKVLSSRVYQANQSISHHPHQKSLVKREKKYCKNGFSSACVDLAVNTYNQQPKPKRRYLLKAAKLHNPYAALTLSIGYGEWYQWKSGRIHNAKMAIPAKSLAQARTLFYRWHKIGNTELHYDRSGLHWFGFWDSLMQGAPCPVPPKLKQALSQKRQHANHRHQMG